MKRFVVVLIGCMLSVLIPASSRPGDVDELNAAIQQKGAKWAAKETPLSITRLRVQWSPLGIARGTLPHAQVGRHPG